LNDLLIYCETKSHPKEEKLLDYVSTIELKDISSIAKEQNNNQYFSFSIVIEDEKWTLQAKTEKERDQWYNDMVRLVTPGAGKQL
jgi:hypothetical protein